MKLIYEVGGVLKTRRIIRGRGNYRYYSIEDQLYLADFQNGAIDLDALEIEYLAYERDGLNHKIFFLVILCLIALIYVFSLIYQHLLTGVFNLLLFAMMIVLLLSVACGAIIVDCYRRTGK